MDIQLKRGMLDVCVLAAIRQADSYGYQIIKDLKPYVDISESTLYPVLRRLQKVNYLRTYDAPYQGRNRRYYAITDEGRNMLEFYENEWNEYKDKIDGLIKGTGLVPSEGVMEEKD